jgi:hypothetical protein
MLENKTMHELLELIRQPWKAGSNSLTAVAGAAAI